MAKNENRLSESTFLEKDNILVFKADASKKEDLRYLFKTVKKEAAQMDNNMVQV